MLKFSWLIRVRFGSRLSETEHAADQALKDPLFASWWEMKMTQKG